MKLSGGFDAKRLRPRERRNWGARLAAGFSALLVIAGILLAMAGTGALFGHAAQLGELNENKAGAATFLGVGLVLLWLGIRFWRRSRLRLRRRHDELNLSPRLMKKHD